MKTQEESHAQQQAVTIEELTKTVERLEKELQECLNPGHGPERPSGRLVIDNYTKHQLYLNAIFFSQRLVLAICRISEGSEPDRQTWQGLRDLLLVHPAAKKHYYSADFMHVVRIISHITDRLGVISHLTEEEMERCRDHDFGIANPECAAAKDIYYLCYWQSISAILLGSPCASADPEEYEFEIEKTYHGFIKVREVLGDADGDVDYTNLNDSVDHSEMKLIVDTMIFALGHIKTYL